MGNIEIHRGDLLEILYELIPKDEVNILFENSIEAITQLEDSVSVDFKNGNTQQFDFVIGADGTHSIVRKLVFGNEDKFLNFSVRISLFPKLKMYLPIGKKIRQSSIEKWANKPHCILSRISPMLF